MASSHFLQEFSKFEMTTYKQPRNYERLRQTHVPFSGSPRRDPRDPGHVLIFPDPYSTQVFYYRFRARDIAYAEELPSQVTIDGQTVTMARVWVRKQCLGTKVTYFVVDETQPI